jgi:hypothetical protein
MGELIRITQESKTPTIICPYCKEEIRVDIQPFRDDVSKILRDKCLKCGGEINVGVLILSHRSLKELLGCINIVVDALKKGNVLLK